MNTTKSPDLRLPDLLEIWNLAALYCSSLDAQDWEGWANLFTPDLKASADGSSFESRDTFVEGVSGLLEGVNTSHHWHTPMITFSDEDENTAYGTWKLADRLTFDNSDPFKPVGVEGDGKYEITYRRIDGVWYIAELRLKRDEKKGEIRPLPGGWPEDGPWGKKAAAAA